MSIMTSRCRRWTKYKSHSKAQDQKTIDSTVASKWTQKVGHLFDSANTFRNWLPQIIFCHSDYGIIARLVDSWTYHSTRHVESLWSAQGSSLYHYRFWSVYFITYKLAPDYIYIRNTIQVMFERFVIIRVQSTIWMLIGVECSQQIEIWTYSGIDLNGVRCTLWEDFMPIIYEGGMGGNNSLCRLTDWVSEFWAKFMWTILAEIAIMHCTQMS